MKLSLLFAVAMVTALICSAEKNQSDLLNEALQANPDKFEKINLFESGPVDFSIKLGETTLTLPDGNEFDGFRLTAPPGTDQKDFVWYFNAPEQWGNWYICPVKEAYKQGFKNWNTADRLYDEFDLLGEEGRLRVLQSLDGDYYTQGEEYIIWFRRVEEGGNDLIKGRIMFAPEPKDEWGVDDYEEALKLEPQPVEIQVELLDSRGGRIMLDPKFYTHKDAETFVDNVFTSFRMFKRMQGGFFIAVEMSMPTCSTKPNFADIRAKFGEPDFVQSSAEISRVASHQTKVEADEEKPVKTDNENTITHYYDYFGFVTSADDPDGPVISVETHVEDYRELKPDDFFELSFSSLDTKNLTVFYQSQKEVGRLYYFNEGAKIPLIIQEPPIGRYRYYNSYLEYLGDGKWTVTRQDHDDEIVYQLSMENNQLSGIGKWFLSDGTLNRTLEFKGGLANGEGVLFDEQGEVVEKRQYEAGKRVE